MKVMDAVTTIARTPHVVDHRALGESRGIAKPVSLMEAV